jgi:hypothetical protein
MGRKARPHLGKFLVKLPHDLVERLDIQAEKESRARSDLLADGGELYLRKPRPQMPRKKK